MQTYLEDCLWGKFLLLQGDFISDHMRAYGEWSEAEVALFKLLLTPESHVVEVGSNIGTHAVALAKICAKGRVFCFEPQRPIFTLLCANLALNNIVHARALHCAVGGEAGSIEIECSDYSKPFNYGSFSLDKGFSTENAYAAGTWREPVRLTTLDSEPALQHLSRVDLLKIDVEGLEVPALQGGKALIARHRPAIFCEANKAETFPAIVGSLRQFGYTPYWFAAQRYRPGNFKGSKQEIGGSDVNLIAFPEGRSRPAIDLVEATSFEQITQGTVKAFTLK